MPIIGSRQRALRRYGGLGVISRAWRYWNRKRRNGDGGDGESQFIFQIDTTQIGVSGVNEFLLPFVSSGVYDLNADWGDGQNDDITTWDQVETIHTYAAPGIYTITLTGQIEGFQFNFSGDAEKMLDISNWGPLLINTDSSFAGCENLDISATNAPTIYSGSMASTFANCFNLGNADLSQWDMSGVTAVGNMFVNCVFFNGDITTWQLLGTTSLSGMMVNCPDFNQDISAWPMAHITEMNLFLFSTSGPGAFDQDLSAWNVTGLTSANLAFTNQTLSDSNYDPILSSWSGQAVQSGVSIHFGNSQYTDQASRDILTDPPNNWAIVDGGPA